MALGVEAFTADKRFCQNDCAGNEDASFLQTSSETQEDYRKSITLILGDKNTVSTVINITQCFVKQGRRHNSKTQHKVE